MCVCSISTNPPAAAPLQPRDVQHVLQRRPRQPQLVRQLPRMDAQHHLALARVGLRAGGRVEDDTLPPPQQSAGACGRLAQCCSVHVDTAQHKPRRHQHPNQPACQEWRMRGASFSAALPGQITDLDAPRTWVGRGCARDGLKLQPVPFLLRSCIYGRQVTWHAAARQAAACAVSGCRPGRPLQLACCSLHSFPQLARCDAVAAAATATAAAVAVNTAL